MWDYKLAHPADNGVYGAPHFPNQPETGRVLWQATPVNALAPPLLGRAVALPFLPAVWLGCKTPLLSSLMSESCLCLVALLLRAYSLFCRILVLLNTATFHKGSKYRADNFPAKMKHSKV